MSANSHIITCNSLRYYHQYTIRVNIQFLLTVWLSLSSLYIYQVRSQDEDGLYRGKYLGKLNSYHHQVSGDVYAVDEYTLLFTKFNYDGNGADTFFWAGAANRPGPQGFIVPDEHGKTNILERYFNKDFTLTLPDRKKITDIKWFAIYDLWSQNTFGDVYIPDEFEPPTLQKIGQLTGKNDHNVSAEAVEITDAKTIMLNKFRYDGTLPHVYFWVGVGAQPTTKGHTVPDEYGYLNPLRAYTGQSITIELPGDLTIFNIDWFSIFDKSSQKSLGSIFIPEALNVPPALVTVISHKNDLPNCMQLHKDYQVSWEIFGPQITIQLAAKIEEDGYMAFGISGSTERSQMLGADVAVAYMDGFRGFVTDYNITALTTCVNVLGVNKGVCKDDMVGGQDNNQIHTAVRENGITIITYRRFLISPDEGDKEFTTTTPIYIVWAMGRLDERMQPSFHSFYPKADISIELNPKEPVYNCFSFSRSVIKSLIVEPWPKTQILDKTIRTFNAYLGPSGGNKGYIAGTKKTAAPLVWYVNGYLAPEIWLRRGLTYNFRVNGGNNVHSAEHYHPLIITDDPYGGQQIFNTIQPHKRKIRTLAGVKYSKKGNRAQPTAAGPLCLAEYPPQHDRRLDDEFLTFKKFNRTLTVTCDTTIHDGALLEFTPNSSWPDTVYYQSFTHAHMGGKMHIIDSFNGPLSGTINVHHDFKVSVYLLLVCVIFSFY